MEENNSFERLRNLDLSRDELDRLGEALKKDEFRKLLVDYVKEVQDPENMKLYEQEISQLEKERGNDITFLHPIPYYVIKTSLNGSKKCFINICGNDLVKKPTSTPSEKDGARGLQWSLPHSLSPPSEDVDNRGDRCQVFDVLFHPDTLHLAHKNKAFRDMVNNTACSAVEMHFDVELDKNNLKFPKLKYKGMARASVIRKPSKEGPVERTPEEKAFFDKIYAQADESTQSYKKHKRNKKIHQCDDKSTYTTPDYNIKHRRHVELEEFTEHKGSKLNVSIPKELIVEVSLPLLKSAADIALDVTEKSVQLVSEKPAKYKLSLSLPYQVDQDNGNAKFDKDLRKLVVTLPVHRKFNQFSVNDFTREDSGVDSDHGSPISESKKGFNVALDETIQKNMSESKVESVSDFRTKFLDENVHYTIPEFTCHVFDGNIAFTLNVKNVDPESISKLIDDNCKSVHVKFVSISPSFYSLHYAFMVKLPVDSIKKDLVSVEAWDNNVILQIPFNNVDNICSSYMYGLSEGELKQKYVEEPYFVNTLHEEEQIMDDIKDIGCTQGTDHKGDVMNVSNSVTPTNGNCDEKHTSESENTTVMENPIVDPNFDEEESSKNFGTSYESSGDELSCSYSPRKSRGILKTSGPGMKFSRSISESSIDDCVGSLDYESFSSAIPEDNEPGVELSGSMKKTVRFNDVVSKQLYRFNSSILGQKRKNQRKSLKKKKAQERRHSESEASEVENKKEQDKKTRSTSDLRTEETNDVSEKNEENIFHLDM